MQINFIDSGQVADTLTESKILSQFEGPGSATTHVLEFSGQDILLTVDACTGNGMVTFNSEIFDSEWGGSVHDNAREVFAHN